MSFGYALRKYREGRGLTLRELGTLCDIDHAYIHRLERDEKTAPSDPVIEALVRNLKLNARRARILRFLIGREADESLIDVFLDDDQRPIEIFESLASMSFRGKRPNDKDAWRKWADRLQELMAEQGK